MSLIKFWFCVGLLILMTAPLKAQPGRNQQLAKQLMSEPVEVLATRAADIGDAARGAIVFHGAIVGCGKCHGTGDSLNRSLGPNLAAYDRKVTDAQLVDSVLRPSNEIREQYQTATVLLLSGQTHAGVLVRSTDQEVVLAVAEGGGVEKRFAADDVESIVPSKVSIMPTEQVALLQNKQSFYDLIRYLIEIRDGGPERAKQLQPTAAQLALELPEYEAHVDHAGIIADLDDEAMKRGKAVYGSLCVNCHGTLTRVGSLPTALRFAEAPFKRGNDPLSMYRTLTHGFGLMLPQPWMVPTQKYDVIHYIRETFLKSKNSSQYFDVSESYLAGLPKGDTRGPAPRKFEPWVNMDYGPYLINTFEIGTEQKNIAQKGIAVQLDGIGGGISRGNTWAVFDHDTMRLAGAWTGEGFIDWKGIHFNGNHGVHPRAIGKTIISNLDGPGWANPSTGEFSDDQRVVGRDNRRFGPLPHDWAQYNGMYRDGRRVVVSYSVGGVSVLERFGAISDSKENDQSLPLIVRTLNIGPRQRPMALVVSTHSSDSATLHVEDQVATVRSGKDRRDPQSEFAWNGKMFGQLDQDDAFELHRKDFTITARIQTRAGGTIFSKTTPGEKWAPGGRTFFVRDGRLGFDIGWVGVVMSQKKVANGKPWQVAVVWEAETETATLFIDGKPSGSKVLAGRVLPENTAVRVGYTSENFPMANNGFNGQLTDVRFYQRALDASQLMDTAGADTKNLVAEWPLDRAEEKTLRSKSSPHHLTLCDIGQATQTFELVAGLSHPVPGAEWFLEGGKLCLRLPSGSDPLKFAIWSGARHPDGPAIESQDVSRQLENQMDLAPLLSGGKPLWPDKIVTTAQRGGEQNGFAVDRLTRPSGNPWLARTRLTGLDFFADSDTMAVCSWDGDVWHVSGLSGLDSMDSAPLTWRRIASGLFQPLGLKIVDGKIFVNCRDQIVILNDLNGDGETDYYQCFNDDHQVTEHFHEFAMGLQRDEEGNFYYAKSARHAKTALVPHHGTLLRVSPDGSTTTILATGFRAANGVCLNPDGSFIVTDQEGHWNPKNRINWVKPGGFYGNMFGYHDVTDSSDDAMDPPLCWITNAFDRSPAELLWVDSERWGPLNGRLLNLSYGYGKVYVVPHETVNGQPQGGMCMLPIDQFPTGTMRGRFSKHDGQLYVCGMFAWGSAQQTEEGGIYRLRYTGGESHVPIELQARTNALTVRLSDDVDHEFASDPNNYRIKVWSLKRTANYGSKHYDEHEINVTSATVGSDGRSIVLHIPDLAPTWCMEVRYHVRRSDGRIAERVIHNTIHQLGD